MWVETDRRVPGRDPRPRGAATFEVAGHHYGLVVIDGLRRAARRVPGRAGRDRSAGRCPAASSRRACCAPSSADRPGPAGVRLLPGRRDRAAEPEQAGTRSSARRRTQAGDAGHRRARAPTAAMLRRPPRATGWPDVAADDRRPGLRATSPGRPPGSSWPSTAVRRRTTRCIQTTRCLQATRRRRPARSRTSRSTARCTGRRGATRRSAGFLGRPDRDDLRRSRRARRLEHLRPLARRVTAKPWWATRIRERLPELLGLPAPRQPVAGGTGRRRDLGQGPPAGRRGGRCSPAWRTAPTQRAPGVRCSVRPHVRRASGWSLLDSRSRRVVDGTG